MIPLISISSSNPLYPIEALLFLRYDHFDPLTATSGAILYVRRCLSSLCSR